MSVFVIAIVLIPLIFSYLPNPTLRQTKHLDNKILNAGIAKLSHIVTNKRRQVYIVTIVVVVLMFVGLSRIKAVGYMVDDISKSNQIYTDLKFFEENVNGVMPFEIVIDTREPYGIQDPKLLRKMNDFETNKLSKYPELSRSISIAQIINFARQEMNGGNPAYYRTPSALELSRILGLFPTQSEHSDQKMMGSMIDSTRQKARISVQMADVGSKRIEELKNEISAIADTVFNFQREVVNEIVTDSIIEIVQSDMDSTVMDTIYHTELEYAFTPVDSSERRGISLTGTSIIFLKGNDYLNHNLMISLLVAFLIIGLIMATIFTSARMIAISLIPNFIPLLITAGLMGYFKVALKPSTVLVFSIAFGIAVDFTIHFLSKYRMELKRNKYNIQKSVKKALNETGVSMVYTSVILFFGFIIFSGSSFGGTIALGIFTSLTLIVALLSNLIVLPSLLLSYDLAKERAKKKKSPLIAYPDEEA
ncbi:MAG: MMPL family transporter [Bacteroidetes bacterium]|nr:MMPL family transporter [Bacteroidota bacterium]